MIVEVMLYKACGESDVCEDGVKLSVTATHKNRDAPWMSIIDTSAVGVLQPYPSDVGFADANGIGKHCKRSLTILSM